MKLSVNILTWNTYKTTIAALDVLKEELKGIDSEIIIVDNGSNDGCQNIATVRNSINQGISKGKNQGIDLSRGEYILLLDGDIVPVPNSIRCLLNHMENNRDCMAIGFLPNKFSNIRNTEGDKSRHEEYCHKLEPIEEHKGHCVYYGMYRREVWDKIHFDEAFGVGYGYEDLDTYMQMDRLGIKQWVAGINHKCGKYYHNINSSIREMGFQEYMRSSMQRSKIFKSKWEGVHVVHA